MKKYLVIILIISIAVFLLGCAESEEDIKTNLVEANSNLGSYSFDMQGEMTMSSSLDGEETTISTQLDMEGKVDSNDRKMSIIGSMTSDMEEMGEVPLEMYIIDDMMYTKVLDTWMKLEFSSEIWDQQDQVKAITELIKTAEIEIVGEESIGGDDYYVVQVTPDLEKVVEQLLEQQNLQGAISEDINIADMVKEYSYTVWVNKDSFFIKKTQVDMLMDFAIEESEPMTLESTTEVTIDKINQDFVIELPEEALDAVSYADLIQQ